HASSRLIPWSRCLKSTEAIPTMSLYRKTFAACAQPLTSTAASCRLSICLFPAPLCLKKGACPPATRIFISPTTWCWCPRSTILMIVLHSISLLGYFRGMRWSASTAAISSGDSAPFIAPHNNSLRHDHRAPLHAVQHARHRSRRNQPRGVHALPPQQHHADNRNCNGERINQRGAAQLPGDNANQRQRTHNHAVQQRSGDCGRPDPGNETSAGCHQQKPGKKDCCCSNDRSRHST